MILLVIWDCEIANDCNFIHYFLFIIAFVNDMIEPDSIALFSRWHRVSLYLHFLASPFTKMTLSCFPDISICLNCLILLATIWKIEITCNNAEVNPMVQSLYLFKLLYSGNWWLRTLQMDAIYSHFKGLISVFLCKFDNCSQTTPFHFWIGEFFLVESAWIFWEDNSIIPMHGDNRHTISFALLLRFDSIKKMLHKFRSNFLQTNEICR